MAQFIAETEQDVCVSEFTMTVELGKLREFARATGYTAGPILEEPHPVIHPTFLTSMVFWQPPEAKLPHEYLGFAEHRILHGEQEYIFGDLPIRAGDVLSVRVRLLPIIVKRGRRGGEMTFGTAVTDFRNPAGRIVAQAKTTIIETEDAP